MTRGSMPDLDRLDGDSLTVAAVASIVGVAPSTLRTWARRYGLEPSGHRAGLHRRYSLTDVSRLQLMRSLARSGLSSRDAAVRALAATPEQLALIGSGRTLGDTGYPGPVLPSSALHTASQREALQALEPAVRTLLATLGRGDARGATALLRIAVRDLGAARTWDERVRPAQDASWALPDGVGRRARDLLTSSVVQAVGDVAPRREPRNALPVRVATLPGLDDPAAVALALAALAERSLRAERLDLGRGGADAWRRLDAVGPAVVALHVVEGGAAGTLAAQARSSSRGAPVLWGAGWLHWPGHEATLADVVRVVEVGCTTDAEGLA